jgi:hypothetical protein
LINCTLNGAKIDFVRKLVKPLEASNSRQVHDSAKEINLKTWRVYPSESARLEVEIKFGASFPACAFSIAKAFSGLL